MKDLKRNNNTNLLRLTTIGSVDDGKSTLIGRMLYESKAILKDQLEAVEKASRKTGMEDINLAYLLDGLRSEREQGITIDVAYRYFSTGKRKFIISDSPGHVQYTRNMVTGASNANVALILIDARNGMTQQTRRHALISSLLQIPHFVICINKMDLMDYKEKVYEEIKEEFENFASKMPIKDIRFIPVSALKGDNVCFKSENMTWYQGSPVLYTLENIHISGDMNQIDCRFPIQTVIRPFKEELHDYRAYAGNIVSGIFKRGDEVLLLPGEQKTRIKRIENFDNEIEKAYPGMAVKLLLEGDFDLGRGDMLVRPLNKPEVNSKFDCMLVWFDDSKKLKLNGRYILKHTTREVLCKVNAIRYKMNIDTLHRDMEDLEIALNDIGRVSIQCAEPIFYDPYDLNRITGSLILVDEQNNNTVAAGMIM